MACLMEIRRRMMGEQAFPPLYKKVDSVWSYRHGGQVDTGVSGNDQTLEIQAILKIGYFQSYAGFFGNYTSETANCWRLIETSSDNGGLISTTNRKASGGSATTILANGFINKKITATLNYTSVTISDGDQTYSQSTEGKTSGTENDTNICIGNSRVLPNATFYQNQILTWYGFRIWRDGVLIRDYVPHVRITDNKAGFYDMINHTFNPSIAKSEFFVD